MTVFYLFNEDPIFPGNIIMNEINRSKAAPTILCRVVDTDPGSRSVLDPYSIGSVDPDPGSGSGSRRAKMAHKSRQ